MLVGTKTSTKIIFLVALIIMLVLLLIFVTYSMRQGNFSRDINSNIMKLDEEAYGNTKFDSSLTKLTPILDKNINDNNSIHIKFNVGGSKKNNTEIIYDIALVNLSVDCELLSPYLKWKLIKNNNEEFTGSLDYRFDTIKDNRLVLTNIQQDLIPYNEDKTVYDHYDFYMWISDSCQEEDITLCKSHEEQTNLLNKVLSGKIEVELYGGTKTNVVREPREELNTSTCIKKDGDVNE